MDLKPLSSLLSFISHSCSVQNVTARKVEDGTVEDVFIIVDRETYQPFEDNRLEEMAEVVLQASTKIGPQF